MAVTIPLEWKITQTGAEAVKARFTELDQAFKNGKITQAEYTRGMKELGKEARGLTENVRTQRQVFAAAHPNLMAVGRAMLGVTAVAHAGASALSLMNLSSIALSSTNSALAAQQLEVDKSQRKYNDAVRQYGEDSPQAKDALAEWNIEQQKLKEVTDQFGQDRINAMLGIGTSIALIGSSVISALPRLAEFIPQLGRLGSAMGKFGVSKMAGIAVAGIGAGLLATGGIDALIGKSDKLEDKLKAVGGVGMVGVGIALAVPEIAKIALIGTAIATATTAIIVFREEIGGFFAWVGEQLAPFAERFMQFFTTDIPAWGSAAMVWLASTFVPGLAAIWEVIKGGFLWFWNGMITAANGALAAIVKGVETLTNGVIAAINGMIRAVNAIRSAIGLSKIDTIGKVSLPVPQISLVAAATGFQGMVTRPTLFLAGEAGAENVAIGSAAASVSNSISNVNGGSGGNTIINIHGSLISEREMYRTIAGYQKRELVRRNFRPR